MEILMKKFEEEIAQLEQIRARWSAVSAVGVPEVLVEKLHATLAQAGYIINFQYRQFSEQTKQYAADSSALEIKLRPLLLAMDGVSNDIKKVRDKFRELEHGNAMLDDGTEPKQTAPRKDSEEPGSSH